MHKDDILAWMSLALFYGIVGFMVAKIVDVITIHAH